MSRSRRITAVAAAAALVAGAFAIPIDAQSAKTARDRVYSEAQAGRGRAIFAAQCASCHGQSLQGDAAPPLVGDDFLADWGSQPLSELVNKIQRTMPADKPGKLTREQATDLVALILQNGKFPSGPAELASSETALKALTITGPAAARPAAIAPATGHVAFPAAGNMAQLMRGILFPSSNLIFNVQTHSPDEVKTTANAGVQSSGFSWVDWGAGIYPPWELVDYAALALAESSPLMLTPGRRCENGKPVPVDDPRWIKFTQELYDAGIAAYKASQTRNQETVSDATNVIADACLHCHEVYRDHPGPRPNAPPNRAARCTPR
jgi:S-disulfanyl-L-cysteine oxidoreductase SoxD